jgi:glycosyltransferase involved in cell wall biosynthesis
MARPRALLLSPEAPYPLWGGGALRTASVLHYLAQRYELDVLLFREPHAGDPALALPEGLAARTGVIELPHHARTFSARIKRNVVRLARGVPPLWDRFAGFEDNMSKFIEGRSYEVAVLEHFWCAPYLRTVRRAANRVVMNLHNVESALHSRFGEAEGGAARWAHGRFAQAYERLEREWLPQFELLLAASEEDARRLNGMNVVVYPNSVPHYAQPVWAHGDRRPVVAFSGNMEYHPNVQAVRWFAREIWPHIRRACPEAEWVLIGKNEQAIRGLVAGIPGVRCTGMVDDAVGELGQAAVAVVPLLSGSGTRLKILEAWAAGTPVVSTAVGAEGLGAAEQLPIEIAGNAGEFSATVLRLLRDPTRRAKLAIHGRRRYEESFTWEAAWKVLSGAGL